MFVILGLVINRVFVLLVNFMYGKDFKFFEYFFVNGDLVLYFIEEEIYF